MHKGPKWRVRIFTVISIAICLLFVPTINAGHNTFGPAEFSATATDFDEVAVRGITTRTSTGPGDIPTGVAGFATADAAGFQATVIAGLFRTFGNATQFQAQAKGVEIFATGNAAAEASAITALVAGTTGNAEGLNSGVAGIYSAHNGSAIGQGASIHAVNAITTGNAVGLNSAVRGLFADTTSGSATGNGAQVEAILARASGSAVGQNSGVRVLNADTSGSATGNGAVVETIRAKAGGNAVSQNSGVRALNADAGGSATGDGTIVEAIRASAGGNAVGPDSVVRGATMFTNGHANGSASAVQSVRVRALGNAVGADSAVTGVAVTAEGVATGSGSVVSAVRARTLAASGPAVAVFAATNSSQGIGVHGVANNPAALAGKFDGRVQIDCPSRPCLTIQGHNIGDLAENMVALGRTEPGDVVVLAQGRTTKWGVARAVRPYDTRVAGIVSEQPRILLQVQGTHTVPVAMVGIVRAKATASKGRVRVGDLLTTSSIPGRLMRCSTPSRCTGAVVAKALEPLRRGNGTILVLVWRQ